MGDPFHFRIRQRDEENDRIPPTRIDILQDREGFNAIDSSGPKTRQQGRIMG
jgi:hypothetical protein